jgi:Icc-related predicted phosphoesterase
MRLLYASDLHGSIPKYEAVLKYAIDQNIRILHIGADLLPKGSCIMEMQKDFIKKYLKDFYQRAKDKGIDILASFGNDDLYTRKKYFRKYATFLDEIPYEKDGYTFKAYSFVPDLPFGLKTGCKLDYPGWELYEKYLGPPVDFTDQGRVIIEDPVKYFKEKGTIKEDLEKISVNDRTIIAIHCPPAGSMGLDVCLNGREVGSKAIFDFIAIKKPLLTLHGHIHESPDVTGIWKTQIGKTVAIQPGQGKFERRNGQWFSIESVTFVDIEIVDGIVRAQRIRT